jgi:inosose dehydratase
MIKIGNAPVSYGAFEVTVGKREGVPGPEAVLDAVRSAGYDGIDLGPVGYLGRGAELRAALDSRGLLLTGGYVEIDVSSEAAAAAGFGELAQVCDQFDAVSSGVMTELLPRPTVALIGSRGPDDGTRWHRLERVVAQVIDQCAVRGYQACLHNEVGTQIASQDSVVAVLERTAAPLCLDTGHLVAAGGDPLSILANWKDRVSHVHLKDARMPDSGQPYEDAMQLWEADVFCPLGSGNGMVDDVLGSLRASGYSGWVVVEQDVLPQGPAGYVQASNQQRDNRDYLRSRGW